jgi:hypothetical protein
VLGVDNRGNVIAVRPKYAQFTWVGPSVSGLKKGQAGPQRDKLKKVFHGVSLEVQFDDLSDFTQESIARRLLARYSQHRLDCRVSACTRNLISPPRSPNSF